MNSKPPLSYASDPENSFKHEPKLKTPPNPPKELAGKVEK